nr:arginine--tRNA ligase [candidate division Zixibacteria bacterium]
MIKDKFREQVAELTALSSARAFPEAKEAHPELFIFDAAQIYNRLETPKNPEMGNFALPLFEAAKIIHKNPAEINRQLVQVQNDYVQEHPESGHFIFSAVGGFNNCRIDLPHLAGTTLPGILKEKKRYGSSDVGAEKRIVIDFSSPNIAKPFGIGHLRTTAIGHSLYRIFEKLGYQSIGINHLGDWGTQFGKMIVAYRKWGQQEDLGEEPVMKLLNLYVRFHREEKDNPSLGDEAREAFKNLESGSPEEIELWKKFKNLSLEAFEKTYQRLGIRFDYYTGESFYNEQMPGVLEAIKSLGLTKISQGALIVDLEPYGLPPCLLTRADGATLYATRDITGIFYRWQTFKFEKALYVVGSAQRDHFRQVFKVVELIEEAEKTPLKRRVSPRLEHVEFGWIKFQDKMMSTREGNIILLDDVLDKAVELARKKIEEKNPDLKEIEKTAQQIGIGAVLFADMSARRQKDVNFDWDEVLNFEGETGPYLQYTHARLSSLVRHYGKVLPEAVDYSLLDQPEEYRVVDLLYRFPQKIDGAAATYEPYVISSYLLELAAAFNKVYQRKDSEGRIDKIISENEKLSEARMMLVEAVRIVIKEGLYLLGIESPEEM